MPFPNSNWSLSSKKKALDPGEAAYPAGKNKYTYDSGNGTNKSFFASDDPSSLDSNTDSGRTNIQSFLKKNNIPGYKKGGKINKTGLAYVHKGERVLNAKQAKSKALKQKMDNC